MTEREEEGLENLYSFPSCMEMLSPGRSTFEKSES